MRPRLLFGIEDLSDLRERARRNDGMLGRIRQSCDELLKTAAGTPNELQAYVSGSEAETMANGFVLTGEAAYADWAKERVFAQLELNTWFAPVHVGGCRVFDHCMANVAAQVAITLDFLGEHFSTDETRQVADRMRGMFLEPFLDGTGEEPEWWFRPDCESNWKVMTCGDSGLALCGFLELWPGSSEALGRATRGVIATLDAVPPEGDWPEGVNYWFGTLRLGLRLARALRRLSEGTIDLFQHPALKATGDFATMLTTPSGAIYNFNDNRPQFGGSEALAMLAVEHRRQDWMHIARMTPTDSALFLACDGPSLESGVPDKALAVFPRSGVATLRSGWERDATFVGFKSGPSTVGHSHLDANSFVIEAGGQPLVIDHPYWPQAHFLGFFDNRGPRWNFDGPATIGHSTLLIDGQGQTHGHEHPGRILATHEDDHSLSVSGDASRCYPGLLRKFVRTILLLKPDFLVIRDVVQCDGERHAEWLLHHAGTVRSEGVVSIIENGSVSMSVIPFLPDRSMGWRINDVERTSIYENSDTRQEVTCKVRYRSFSTFQKAEQFEFLFGLRVNGCGAGEGWEFQPAEEGWALRPPGNKIEVKPHGDRLSATVRT